MWQVGVLCAVLLALLAVLAWVAARPSGCAQVSLAHSETREIPRIIHQTWKTKKLTDFYHKCSNTWKKFNPSFDYRFYDDTDCELFVKTHYPDFYDTYREMQKPVEKADLFRYLIVHHFGGMYADMDTTCVSPIDKLFAEDDRVVVAVEEVGRNQSIGQILQWAFAARPRQPLFLDIAREIVVRHNYLKSAGKPLGIDDDTLTLWKTGPMLFTEYVMKHHKKDPKSVTIHEKCTLGAYDLTPKCLEKAYLVHHFDGSWKKDWSEHLQKFKTIH